jgi:hypothetical protein
LSPNPPLPANTPGPTTLDPVGDPDSDVDAQPDGCPSERFDTVHAAQAELLARRARAALSGSPHTVPRTAYPCEQCGGAHLIRVGTPHGAAA